MVCPTKCKSEFCVVDIPKESKIYFPAFLVIQTCKDAKLFWTQLVTEFIQNSKKVPSLNYLYFITIFRSRYCQ